MGSEEERGGFLFGALAGVVAGLLLAPKSGRETREQLFGQGGFGGQVDRIKGAIGAGKDSAADQNEALRAQDRGDARAPAQPDGRRRRRRRRRGRLRRPRRHRSRRRQLSGLARNGLRAAAAVAGAAALGLVYLLHEAQWVRRVDRRLPAPDADAALDGLTVVQLSDFHVGFTPSFNLRATRKAVDLALAARAGPRPHHRRLRRRRRTASASSAASCGACAPPLGVFGVLGNHDHGDSKAPFVQPTDPALRRELRRAPARQRDGDAWTRGGAVVQIGGVDDTDGGHDDLPAVLARARPPARRACACCSSHHAEVVRRTAPGDFHLTLRRRHARRPDLPAAARPPHPAQRPAAPSSPRGPTTSAAARSTSRAASAPACCRSAPSAGPRSSCSTWRPAGRRRRAAGRARPRDAAALAGLLALCLAARSCCGRPRSPPAAATPTPSPVSTGSRPPGAASRSARTATRTVLLLRRRRSGRSRRRARATSSAIAEPMGGQTVVRRGDRRGRARAGDRRARRRCSSGCSSTSSAEPAAPQRQAAAPAPLSGRARRAATSAATRCRWPPWGRPRCRRSSARRLRRRRRAAGPGRSRRVPQMAAHSPQRVQASGSTRRGPRGDEVARRGGAATAAASSCMSRRAGLNVGLRLDGVAGERVRVVEVDEPAALGGGRRV